MLEPDVPSLEYGIFVVHDTTSRSMRSNCCCIETELHDAGYSAVMLLAPLLCKALPSKAAIGKCLNRMFPVEQYKVELVPV